MAMSGPTPYVQPALGRGEASKQSFDPLHERSYSESAQNSLGLLAVKDKGIHKLMRSGTRRGKIVKFFYKLTWDFTYR